METSCSPRPSAARRLSSGIVYPLRFFQLEMHGGIFQSCWSFWVILRGGECITGTGGDGGPRGTRLCLNFGGSMGSTGASTMRMTRVLAPDAPTPCDGVYFMKVGPFLSAVAFSSDPATPATLSAIWAARASRVRSVFSAALSSAGLTSSSSLRYLAATRDRMGWYRG